MARFAEDNGAIGWTMSEGCRDWRGQPRNKSVIKVNILQGGNAQMERIGQREKRRNAKDRIKHESTASAPFWTEIRSRPGSQLLPPTI